MGLKEIVHKMLNILPEHACGLILEHNPQHRNDWTVKEHMEIYKEVADLGMEDFASPEQYQKAIDSNELWKLQWYPNTPIGFNDIYAADFEMLLEDNSSQQLAKDFLECLPPHDDLTILHNPQRGYYESAKDYIGDAKETNFASVKDYKQAVEENELWEIFWSVESEHSCRQASSLEALLANLNGGREKE